jgi:EAL domain-containing protein (putative c-di-GMP-specific phosphodiesterase class I)
LRIVDCESTNGTFLKHRRLTEERLLESGDEIQFGNIQFLVARYDSAPDQTRIINPHARLLEQMLQERAVTPHFQPIIHLQSAASVVAFELLGRISYAGLPNNPGHLFQIAKLLGRDVELSVLFRDEGLTLAAGSHLKSVFFFNALPAEMKFDVLARTLTSLHAVFPGLKLGLELSENAVVDLPVMKQLRQILKDLNYLLVYDDFGAGQARLVELMEAPPDVLKFDISLIRDIHQRSEVSRSIVGGLVRMARTAGIRTLAEGVECAEEAEVCLQLGFDLAQGYYFGRPAPLPQR